MGSRLQMTLSLRYLLAFAMASVTVAQFITISQNGRRRGLKPAYGANAMMILDIVGIMEDKVFFVNTTERSWTEASLFCQSKDLELASIQTDKQWTLLEDTIRGNGTYYWTSGKEARRSSLFMWNQTGEYLNTLTAKTIGETRAPSPLCLAFGGTDKGSGKSLEIFDCRDKLLGTLCQGVFANGSLSVDISWNGDDNK